MTDDSANNSTKMDMSDEDEDGAAPPLPSSLVVTDFDEDFDKSRRKLAAYTQLLKDGLEKSAGPYLFRQVKYDDERNKHRQAAAMAAMNCVVINDRYRLDACLGHGSYGQGWKAMDLKTSQVVFLKTYKMDDCEGLSITSRTWEHKLKFIAKEIRIARDGILNNKFLHPNVVNFYNAQFRGTAKRSDGTKIEGASFPFLVTEFIDGEDLQNLLDKYFKALWFRKNYPSKTWPIETTPKKAYVGSCKQVLDDPAKVRELFVQMMKGVKYLHSKLVYVWDIKADNMMVATTASGHQIKIMDFGMGKSLKKERVNKKGMISNSTTYEHLPKHQAPELRRGGYGLHTGEKVSPGPPDIFTLGQLLLGMTCLKDYLPHMMRTRNYDLPSLLPGCDTLEKLFGQARELKNRFNKDINPDGLALFDLLSRMLDSDPEKRPTPDEVLKHTWCKM